MDAITFLPPTHATDDSVEHDLAEVDAAISLVALGLATRVRLVGLSRPEAVASSGLAHAQEAGVGFSLERGASGAVALTLGPRS